MNPFTLAVLCLLVIFVSAQKKATEADESTTPHSERPKTDKILEKKKHFGDKSEVVVPNKFKRQEYLDDSHPVSHPNEDRAVVEKTFKDFFPLDAVQNIFLKVVKPEAPVLDTASDVEKSAISKGSGTEALGDLVIKGSETIFKALNSVLEIPKKALGKLSVGATETLNKIGAYFVGI